MALPGSGSLSISQISVELGRSSTATTSLGESASRTLAGVPSGAISISNFYGKSNRVAITITLSSNQQNVNIFNLRGGSYVAGNSDITVNVNSGVYIGASSTGVYAMNISGFSSGDTVRLNNSGTILGCGAAGGGGGAGAQTAGAGGGGGMGGYSLYVGFPTTIYNYANIWGGGGGGGGGGGAYNQSKFADASAGGGGGGGGAGYSAGGGGAGGGATTIDGSTNRVVGQNGGGGSTLSAGGGGAGGNASAAIAGNGGSGGGNGAGAASGGAGTTGTSVGGGGAGGGAGYYIVGNGNVSWGAFGDRRGLAA